MPAPAVTALRHFLKAYTPWGGNQGDNVPVAAYNAAKHIVETYERQDAQRKAAKQAKGEEARQKRAEEMAALIEQAVEKRLREKENVAMAEN